MAISFKLLLCSRAMRRKVSSKDWREDPTFDDAVDCGFCTRVPVDPRYESLLFDPERGLTLRPLEPAADSL
jgi:hypothetical protein